MSQSIQNIEQFTILGNSMEKLFFETEKVDSFS